VGAIYLGGQARSVEGVLRHRQSDDALSVEINAT